MSCVYSGALAELAGDYPVLFLDPDKDSQDKYRRVVLRGEEPESKSLSHYHGNPADRLESVETSAGPVRVLTLGDRRDFELVLRGLMAVKDGPDASVPASQGAATVTVFNWGRIRAHLAEFPPELRGLEFKRFAAVRENITDLLIVLSRGPYSNISAAAAGFGEEEWLEHSDAVRRFHELTHVICRRLYPDDIDAVRDELIADAVGLYAAFGRYDARLAALFLGVAGGAYTGGRLENYTDEPGALAPLVSAALDRITTIIGAQGPEAGAFDLITPLMAEDCLRFSGRPGK